VRAGETVTTAGPVIETPKHLEGYFMLDCKDLEKAIGWAQIYLATALWLCENDLINKNLRTVLTGTK
jgi:hypothetical protein